jgi:hypothetical protein
MLKEHLMAGEDPPRDHTYGGLEKTTFHLASLARRPPESHVETAWTFLKHGIPMGFVKEVAMA